jgi:hypothetical protein
MTARILCHGSVPRTMETAREALLGATSSNQAATPRERPAVNPQKP